MALRRRSAQPLSSSRAHNLRRAAARHFRPRVEPLERRCLLAADPLLFIEDFSLDSDRFQQGFDSADSDPNTPADRLLIHHSISARDTAFVSTNEVLVGSTYQPSEPYALGLLGPATDTISVPATGSPGGLMEGESISAVAIAYSGLGTIRFVGDNGTRTIHVSTPFGYWQSVTVTGNSPSDTGQEVGTIRSVVISTIEVIAIDDIALLLNGIIVNNPPVANTDLVSTLPGTAIDIDVLANDGDADGDASILYTFDRQSEQGGTIAFADGKLRYTPPASFHGADTFHYTISDNRIPAGSEVQGTVQVTVNTPPPAPIVRIPVPHGYSGPFSFESAAILAGLSDADGDPLSIASITTPLLGSLTRDSSGRFTYVPRTAGGLVLDDRFEFRLSDTLAIGEQGLALLAVDNNRPVAAPAQFFLDHGTPGPLRSPLRADDADGDPLVLHLAQGPQHGSLTTFRIVNGVAEFEYAPSSGDFRGYDSFSYFLTDAYSFSATARIEFIVSNTPPVFRDDPALYFYLFEKSTLLPNGSTAVRDTLDSVKDENDRLFRRAFDLDGDPLVFELVTEPAYLPRHGDVVVAPDGAFTYTPRPDPSQTGFESWIFLQDTFYFRVFDGYEYSPIAAADIYQDLGSAVARTDAYSVAHDEVLSVGGLGVLDNDVFASGLSLVLRNGRVQFVDSVTASYIGPNPTPAGEMVSRHGTFPRDENGMEITRGRLEDTGEFTFRPRDSFRGVTSFFYHYQYSLGAQSGSSGTGRIMIDVTEFPEADHDGILDSIESRVPWADGDINGDGVNDRLQFTGDGNGDSVFDRHQAEVASRPAGLFTNTPADRWVTFVSAPGTSLFNVESVSNPSIDDTPRNSQFRLGFFSFYVVGLAPGEATTVTLYPHDPTPINSYYKWGGPNTGWYEFLYDGRTGAELFDNDEDGWAEPEDNDGMPSRIVLHFVDGQRGDDDGREDGIIFDPGGPAFVSQSPTVETVTINDGSAQRSMVTSLTVTFDSPVTIQPGAFDLRMVGARKPVDLKITHSTVAGQSIARLTFQSGRDVLHASLRDGAYRLTIRAAKVRDASGNQLDGNGDDTAGGDYALNFFRLFGDTDGDGDVDALDKGVFQSANGKRSKDPGYLWYLDANANGKVWAEDLALFLLGYCKSSRRR